jgi:hypothetical protein
MMTRERIISTQKTSILIQSMPVMVVLSVIFTPTITPVRMKMMVSLPYWIDAQTLCSACYDSG